MPNHNRLHKIELLAPARDADTGIEAIKHGADAVYIGGPNLERALLRATRLTTLHGCAILLTCMAPAFM